MSTAPKSDPKNSRMPSTTWHAPLALTPKIETAKGVHEAIDNLSRLREDLEKTLSSVERNYDRNKTRVLEMAKAKQLSLSELDTATKRLLKNRQVLDGLSKIMKGWTYIDLTQKAFLSDKKSERDDARKELVKDLAMETKPYFVKLGKEIGLLSKDPAKSIASRAKGFIIKTVGEKPLLLVEALDLPVTVLIEILTPSDIGLEIYDIGNPDGNWTVEQGQEILQDELSLPNPDVEAVHRAMAAILAKQQREEAARQKRAAIFDQAMKSLASNRGPKW